MDALQVQTRCQTDPGQALNILHAPIKTVKAKEDINLDSQKFKCIVKSQDTSSI